MNNEIKEILDTPIFIIDDEGFTVYINDKINNYITNLQQLEQEHKKINGELREENSKLKIALQNIQEDYDRRTKENERLKENAIHNDKVVDKAKWNEMIYKSRCEKASEYIKEHIRIDDEYPAYMEMLVEERDNLLNILQNGDNKDD